MLWPPWLVWGGDWVALSQEDSNDVVVDGGLFNLVVVELLVILIPEP